MQVIKSAPLNYASNQSRANYRRRYFIGLLRAVYGKFLDNLVKSIIIFSIFHQIFGCRAVIIAKKLAEVALIFKARRSRNFSDI